MEIMGWIHGQINKWGDANKHKHAGAVYGDSHAMIDGLAYYCADLAGIVACSTLQATQWKAPCWRPFTDPDLLPGLHEEPPTANKFVRLHWLKIVTTRTRLIRALPHWRPFNAPTSSHNMPRKTFNKYDSVNRTKECFFVYAIILVFQ